MKKENRPEAQPQKALHLDGEYPGLNALSYAIGFTEQLLAIISEPLLIGCAVVAVIDFVTGGRLLTLPLITYTWAASLGIAVSACFIVTWRRAIRALTLNYYGVAIGLALLGLVLGLVDWAAIDVQSLQQTLSISFANALAQLSLNIIVITHLRSAVAIAMAVVVAVSNHTAVTTAQAPKRRFVFVERMLDRIAPVVSNEIEQTQVIVTELPANTEPTKLRTPNFTEPRKFTEHAYSEPTELFTELPNLSPNGTEPQQFATEPFTELGVNTEPNTEPSNQNFTELTELQAFATEPGPEPPNGTELDNKQAKIWAILATNPDISVSELVEKCGVSKAHASEQRKRYRLLIEAEQTQTG